jgi:hypothetical protein
VYRKDAATVRKFDLTHLDFAYAATTLDQPGMHSIAKHK